MDRADLDQLAALAGRRAEAAAAAAAELRRVGEDLVGLAAGFVGLRHTADALDLVAETDRQYAALCRRLALAARATLDLPEPEPATPVADDDDWRTWTEDDFVEDDVESDGGAGPPPPAHRRPDPYGDSDWDDEAPLAADVRLGVPPTGNTG